MEELVKDLKLKCKTLVDNVDEWAMFNQQDKLTDALREVSQAGTRVWHKLMRTHKKDLVG